MTTDPTSVSPAARAEEIGGLLDRYADMSERYGRADREYERGEISRSEYVLEVNKQAEARNAVDAAIAALVRERDEARRAYAELAATHNRGLDYREAVEGLPAGTITRWPATLTGGPSHVP